MADVRYYLGCAHEQFRPALAGHDGAPRARVFAGDRPQDTADPRAKNTGHGKRTADKWNQ